MSAVATANEDLRKHEVRIGMSLYWVDTWPEGHGFGYAIGSMGPVGWTSGTRQAALAMARRHLTESDSAQRGVL